MDTLPLSLDSMAAIHGGLHDFRMTSAVEIRALLSRVCSVGASMHLNATDGTSWEVKPWVIDSARSAISMMFEGEKDDPRLQTVLGCQQVTAVGGIDDVKIQFDVQGLVLVLGNMSSALRCALPREVYRFQRRESFRVRPLARSAPVARIAHPGLPALLRILDVSSGGCALFLPEDTPPIEVGTVLRGVVLDLEVNVHLQTDLRVQRVSVQAACTVGNRLGCQFLNPNSSSLRNLQHYIAQTQKRTRLVSP
ncbi:MAG: flagellar brake protein [Burkholderiales bacterium]|jgi:c-di-GMP-binding flagellar brake protein YcgR|nr:flagellar brake protein [Burkholderiales bacterium]